MPTSVRARAASDSGPGATNTRSGSSDTGPSTGRSESRTAVTTGTSP